MDTIAQIWADGHTLAEFAAAHDATPKVVLTRLGHMRRDPCERSQAPLCHGDGAAQRRHEEIRNLGAHGPTRHEIADTTGYTLGSVRTVLSHR
jgi:hypothetical protein